MRGEGERGRGEEGGNGIRMSSEGRRREGEEGMAWEHGTSVAPTFTSPPLAPLTSRAMMSNLLALLANTKENSLT